VAATSHIRRDLGVEATTAILLETMALEWTDVDLAKRQLCVQRSIGAFVDRVCCAWTMVGRYASERCKG